MDWLLVFVAVPVFAALLVIALGARLHRLERSSSFEDPGEGRLKA